MTNPKTATLACVALAAAFPAAPVLTGQPTNFETALQHLTSPDSKVSGKAFDDLLRPFVNTDDVPGLVRDLLRAHPQQADRIRLALIKALENVNAHREQEEDKGNAPDEEFAGYSEDLAWAVSSLRDPRSVNALVRSTGPGTVDALADLFPYSVDALVGQSREADRYFRGQRQSYRASALQILGLCLTRVALVRAHPEAVPKIRAAFLAELDDPDGGARAWAAEGLSYFRDDPDVQTRLQALALTDQYTGTVWRSGRPQEEFLVREAAKRALSTEGTENLSYVNRQPTSGECRVQPASEQPAGEPLIGPISHATFQMCTHYDPSHKDPYLCWRFYPQNACSQ